MVDAEGHRGDTGDGEDAGEDLPIQYKNSIKQRVGGHKMSVWRTCVSIGVWLGSTSPGQSTTRTSGVQNRVWKCFV